MKKKKLTPTAAVTTTTTTSTTTDLKTLIHEHSLFFDKLVELIPARFYLPNEDDIDKKPWFQGLSNAAKASAKQQTKENIKKARRDRLDPEKSQTTTLDLLKQSIENEKSTQKSNTDSDDDNNNEEIVVKQITNFDGDNRSVTYEELQQRLHHKIQELHGNRGMGKKSQYQNKRRRSTELEEKTGSDGRDGNLGKSEGEIEKDVTEATKGIEFGKVKLGGDEEVGRKKKKGKVSRAKELEVVKRLQEVKSDPERGKVVAKKHSWQAATSRAAGIKVHDDPRLLKQSMHKEKKRHEKNVKKWKDRVESREKIKVDKQQKRAGNIAERIHQNKMRKIAKREKKLMRPGFEGRKEGYINEV